VQGARRVLPGTTSALLTRADELEVLLRVSLGDLRFSADLASRIPAVRRHLLLARVALASGDPDGAREHLKMLAPAELTPRSALMHQILMAATAIEHDDPAAAAILGGVLGTAGREGFVNTVVTAAPQVTSYLVEKSHAMPEPLLAHLIEAALEVRSAQPEAPRSRGALAEPLTAAELRVLRLLPTASYLQMAEILCISHNTVKSHLRSIYQKLGVSSRADAIERAMDLRLL
jgi:LuxR family maltose regulon positive regulatory protein